MRFLRDSPAWYRRDCTLCQTIVMNAHGEPVCTPPPKGGEGPGNAIPLKGKAPDCKRTPCRCEGPESKPVLWPVSGDVYRLYTLCHEFHALPRPGAVSEQDPLLMSLFLAVTQADSRDEQAERVAAAKAMGPLAGLLRPKG